MEFVRQELLPSVTLTCLPADKFKTGFFSATLLTQLDRRNAASNALLPYVLRRGTASSPDMAALQARLDELYGAAVEPRVRKLGEIQCVGFQASFCDDRFLPGETDAARGVAALLGELFLSPHMRGGLFLPEIVESERDKLIERMDALLNSKPSYAAVRMMENMCCYEPYGVRALGTREEAENIYYVNLSRHFRSLLASSPLEFFYCGARESGEVAETLYDAFLTLPRGEIDWELGTDIRMNTVEEQPRYFTEELDVGQGQLVLGFRLGKCMEKPDYAVLRVLNAVYGGGVSSKLFANVRERLSLCYFAHSFCDYHKGVMTVCAGIDFDRYDTAREEILAQLEAIKAGDVTPEELETAKRGVASALRTTADTQAALESFWLEQRLEGLDYGPEELAALVEEVTLAQVVEAAQDVQCDTVYFLKNSEGADE